MLEEIWKDIEGYEGLYQISSYGQVKSLGREFYVNNQRFVRFPKILKFTIGTSGYPTTHLYSEDSVRETIMIHRLVAKHFIPNPEDKYDVNHINGDKTDNRVINLEWNTRSENINHSYKIGTHKIRNGLNNKNTKITKEGLIDILTNYYWDGKTSNSKQLADKYGISYRTVCEYVRKYKLEDLLDGS